MNERARSWTFLTNHAAVLLCLARDPTLRIRDLSAIVGITERATQQIIRDLERERYITVARAGRRNTYKVNTGRSMRHPFLKRLYRVSDLLEAFPV